MNLYNHVTSLAGEIPTLTRDEVGYSMIGKIVPFLISTSTRMWSQKEVAKYIFLDSAI